MKFFVVWCVHSVDPSCLGPSLSSLPRHCTYNISAAIWINPDCCGLFCAVITYGLVAYAQYAVTACILVPWMGDSFFGVTHTVAFNVLACLAHASHARAMLTDPGAVSCQAQVR